jgi:transposase
VTSDRWWAYSHLPLARRQICRSHLQRDLTAHAEAGGGGEKELSEAGRRVRDEVFWAWEIYQHTGERKELKRRIRQLRRELKPILRQYSGKAPQYQRSRELARSLLKVWPALWTFANRRGVQPTNNHAERSLRGAVICRKLSLGSQSADGERRIERLLSASTTYRLQHRSLFEYLSELLTANTRGPLPTLT